MEESEKEKKRDGRMDERDSIMVNQQDFIVLACHSAFVSDIGHMVAFRGLK